MNLQTLEQSPRNHRDGQVSFLLLHPGQFGSRNLAITWVEGAPGSEQPAHSHATNEQVYVIVSGRGLMRVGGQAEEVSAGTAVFVPPNTSHSIVNIGDQPLVFVSATSPPFDMQQADSPFAYTTPE